MYAMFYQAITFNQNIGSWNTAKVTAMRFMFYQASTFNQDLSGWCVQTHFDAEPDGFKADGNSTWTNDVAKQPVWYGASCP
jgi:surface protein